MKNPILLLLAFVLVLLSPGCHQPSPAPVVAGNSPLWVVYACTPTLSAPLFIFENGQGIFGTGCGFPINYAEDGTPSGNNAKLTIYRSDPSLDTVFYTGTYNLLTDTSYSLFFGGPAANPCRLFMENDMSAPAAGMAKVRFVNLSSDGFSFNCFINSVKIDSSLTYQVATPFLQCTPDSLASLIFTDALNPAVTVKTDSTTLLSGGIYTIILAGNYGASNFGLTTQVIWMNPKVKL